MDDSKLVKARGEHAWLADDVAPAMRVEAARIVSPKDAGRSSNSKEDGRPAEPSEVAYHASALQSKGLLLLLLGLLITVDIMCTSALHSTLPRIYPGTHKFSDKNLLDDMLKRMVVQGARCPSF